MSTEEKSPKIDAEEVRKALTPELNRISKKCGWCGGQTHYIHLDYDEGKGDVREAGHGLCKRSIAMELSLTALRELSKSQDRLILSLNRRLEEFESATSLEKVEDDIDALAKRIGELEEDDIVTPEQLEHVKARVSTLELTIHNVLNPPQGETRVKQLKNLVRVGLVYAAEKLR